MRLYGEQPGLELGFGKRFEQVLVAPWWSRGAIFEELWRDWRRMELGWCRSGDSGRTGRTGSWRNRPKSCM